MQHELSSRRGRTSPVRLAASASGDQINAGMLAEDAWPALKPWYLVWAAVVWYAAAVATAQTLTPPSYSWLERTVSALGAQGYSHAWVVRAGMVGYGLLLSAGLVRRMVLRRRLLAQDLVLLLHAFMMTVAGLLSTSPFVPGIEYSAIEARWHWNFAMGASASVGASVLSHLLAPTSPNQRRLHSAAATLILALSIGFGLAAARTIVVGPGLVQRLMHGVGLAWISAIYGRPS